MYDEFLHSTKRRFEGQSYGAVDFVLSGKTQVFERKYPNLIEFLSDCGGIIEVIFFVFFTFGFLHHFVFLDMEVINKAILSG